MGGKTMTTMYEFVRNIAKVLREEDAEPVGEVELVIYDCCANCKNAQRYGSPTGIEGGLDFFACGLKDGPFWPASELWLGFLMKCPRYEFDEDRWADEELREMIRTFAGITEEGE